ncbi:MAG TPA: ROK family protein [Acidimicrobiales bacterium]
MRAHTLAVDLGGTHMRCARVLPDGSIADRALEPTPHDGSDTSALVSLLTKVASTGPCASAVIGVPGRVDYRNGILEYAPNLPPGWVATLTEAGLSRDVGLAVALANDADLAAVGEAYFGAGAGFTDVAYVTLSTGVGAGVVLSGLLVHGRRSLAELGHSIIALDRLRAGQPATVEELASGTALGQAAARAGLGPLGRDVLDAAGRGDGAARAIWDDLVAAAAAGLVNMAWLFTPEVIVVGGGLGLVGDALLDPLRRAVETDGPPVMDPPVAIVPAGLGDDAGLAGAAAWGQAFRPEAAGR